MLRKPLTRLMDWSPGTRDKGGQNGNDLGRSTHCRLRTSLIAAQSAGHCAFDRHLEDLKRGDCRRPPLSSTSAQAQIASYEAVSASKRQPCAP